jgi:hypothetical protein
MIHSQFGQKPGQGIEFVRGHKEHVIETYSMFPPLNFITLREGKIHTNQTTFI